jgi:hypothetical protein
MIEFVFVPIVLCNELIECSVTSGWKDFSCDSGDGLAVVMAQRRFKVSSRRAATA